MATIPGAHPGDEHARIVAWVAERLGVALREGATSGSKVGGFSNEALILERADGGRLFVRMAPVTGPFPPYDVVREGRLQQRLRGHLDVPDVLATCDGAGIGTRPFVVMDFLDGVVKLPTRGSRRRSEEESEQIAADLARTLARLHAIDPAELSLAEIVGDPQGVPHATRVMGRWERVLHALRVPIPPAALYGLWWLREHRPPERELRLVHGDFRLGNLMWCGERVVLLDWEGAQLGDPLFDLGWICMGAIGDDELVMGLVPKHRFLDLYEAAGGVELDRERLRWWETLAIWQLLCQEPQLFDYEHDRDPPDLRSLIWEVGSNHTAFELLERIRRQEVGTDAV